MIFVLVSCNKNEIAFKKSFGDEIDLKTNLVFEFEETIVSNEWVGVWKENDFLSLDPQVEGEIKWDDAKTLIFSPKSGFDAATKYKGKFKSQSSDYRKVSEIEFVFSTKSLEILNLNLYWAGDENSPVLSGSVEFNYEVDLALLTKFLGFKSEGKELKFSTSKNLDLINFNLINANGFEDKELEVTLKKGFQCVPCGSPIEKELTSTVTIPNKYQFMVVSVSSENELETRIFINTNQSPSKNQNLSSLFKLEPFVSFVAEWKENGVLLKGDFSNNVAYNLVINKDFKGLFGGRLKSDFSTQVMFGEPKPMVSFLADKSLYLSSAGSKSLLARIIGVEQLKLKVYKIYENNIQHFLRASGQINSYRNYDDYYDGYDYEEIRRYPYSFYGDFDEFGDLLFEKKLNVTSLPKKGKDVVLTLDDESITNSNKGFYVVLLNSDDQLYLNDVRIVALSDIGLIAKASAGKLHVYANSILTGQALKNVEISLTSKNNQKGLNAKTDGEGKATFTLPKNQPIAKLVTMITASLDNDFNYLHFQQTEVDLSRYEVGGVGVSESGFQGFVYAERDLYRPGETIHVNALVRDKNYLPVSDQPASLKIISPNGRTIHQAKGLLSESGSFSLDFKLSENAITGTYVVELISANQVMLDSKTIGVENFMPDRIKNEIKTAKSEINLNEKSSVFGVAQMLYGAPAANRNYEIDVSFRNANISSETYKNFMFNIEGLSYSYINNQLKTGKTDNEGKWADEFKPEIKWKNNGIIKANFFVTVFDESGRPVNRTKSIDIITQDYFVGIQPVANYVDVRSLVSFPIITIDSKGNFKPGAVRVQVVKKDWHTLLEKDYYGGYRYVSKRQEVVMKEQQINTSVSPFQFNFTPSESGDYEIRAFLPGASSYVKHQFYAYGWGYTQNTAFEVDKEGHIIIESDKKSYQKGETAKLIFKTPFSGKILVTLERDELIHEFWLNTDKKTATLDILLNDNHLPNVYVSATLFRPMGENAQTPLTVAHGYTNLMVEDPNKKLDLKISAPESIRSSTKQKILITGQDLKKKAEVTVAVVDEGILLIRNQPNPDVYKHFFQKQRLNVSSYDTYLKLFPEIFLKQNVFGADGSGMSKRSNPLGNSRAGLVSFWSGIMKPNNKGEVEFEIDVPSFSGDLRIVAVAYQDNKFGTVVQNMKVADPIIAQMVLPRFINAGDTVKASLSLTNTTNSEANVSVNLKLGEHFVLLKSNSNNLKVPVQQEVMYDFMFTSQKGKIGEGTIQAVINFRNENLTCKNSLFVSNHQVYAKSHKQGMLSKNQKFNFKPLRNEQSVNLVLSSNPAIQLGKNFEDLVVYPHGCVEQTVSASFPQLYLNDIARVFQEKKRGTINTGVANV
ncbi:MAG: MG2 domain-containing protein, partial [Cytophagales bacterium]